MDICIIERIIYLAMIGALIVAVLVLLNIVKNYRSRIVATQVEIMDSLIATQHVLQDQKERIEYLMRMDHASKR